MIAPMVRPLRRALLRTLLRTLAPIAALFALASCYLPGSFDAEIELSRTGLYKMSFDGYIVDVNFYNEIRENKLTKEEQAEKAARFVTDFTRDSDTKEASYFGQGAFKVVWSKSGDILKARKVTFFRRNEEMLSISYDEKQNVISLGGKYIKKDDAERLQQMGLNVQGVLKIKTDARVTAHNANPANVTKEGLVTVYGWRLTSITDPAPRMKIAF
jgi:hypothetical protein